MTAAASPYCGCDHDLREVMGNMHNSESGNSIDSILIVKKNRRDFLALLKI